MEVYYNPKGRVLKSLPLEIGGIMTSRPIEETNSILKEMIATSHNELKVMKI